MIVAAVMPPWAPVMLLMVVVTLCATQHRIFSGYVSKLVAEPVVAVVMVAARVSSVGAKAQ